ncbi:MAG: hypothetical protein ACKOBV_04430, partial [Candidatus Kapaibacterium sp.]
RGRGGPEEDREYARGEGKVKGKAWRKRESLMQTTGVKTFRVGLGGTNLLDQRDLRSVPSLIGRQFSMQVQLGW